MKARYRFKIMFFTSKDSVKPDREETVDFLADRFLGARGGANCYGKRIVKENHYSHYKLVPLDY